MPPETLEKDRCLPSHSPNPDARRHAFGCLFTPCTPSIISKKGGAFDVRFRDDKYRSRTRVRLVAKGVTNVAKTSQASLDYHKARAQALAAFNKEHGTRHKSLKDAGISL